LAIASLIPPEPEDSASRRNHLNIRRQKRKPWYLQRNRYFLRPMAGISLHRLTVTRKPAQPSRGIMIAGALALPVALGRGGVKANKREGDGATPRGRFRLKRLWWRNDRHARPRTFLPVRPIRHNDGWCEDPRDRRYNRHVTVPTASNADRLARGDALYDFIIELDHNTRPRVAGRGSAVFIHIARDGFAPTAGCVALTMPALRRLIARLGPHTLIEII
jgi:L,D-peptidoglycan transpeptidase YkuD (ErfK/YbiS/YcfS/YnhG family)